MHSQTASLDRDDKRPRKQKIVHNAMRRAARPCAAPLLGGAGRRQPSSMGSGGRRVREHREVGPCQGPTFAVRPQRQQCSDGSDVACAAISCAHRLRVSALQVGHGTVLGSPSGSLNHTRWVRGRGHMRWGLQPRLVCVSAIGSLQNATNAAPNAHLRQRVLRPDHVPRIALAIRTTGRLRQHERSKRQPRCCGRFAHDGLTFARPSPFRERAIVNADRTARYSEPSRSFVPLGVSGHAFVELALRCKDVRPPVDWWSRRHRRPRALAVVDVSAHGIGFRLAVASCYRCGTSGHQRSCTLMDSAMTTAASASSLQAAARTNRHRL